MANAARRAGPTSTAVLDSTTTITFIVSSTTAAAAIITSTTDGDRARAQCRAGTTITSAKL